MQRGEQHGGQRGHRENVPGVDVDPAVHGLDDGQAQRPCRPESAQRREHLAVHVHHLDAAGRELGAQRILDARGRPGKRKAVGPKHPGHGQRHHPGIGRRLGERGEHRHLVPGLGEGFAVRLDHRLHPAEGGQVVVTHEGDPHAGHCTARVATRLRGR